MTVEALDAVSAALGEEKITAGEFSDALKLVFARTDIGVIPTSVDEVTIGSASMLRADHPRFVLVLGLNEGEFPRSVPDDGLICDEDKATLEQYGVHLSSTREERNSDEYFYVYRAFCAPGEGLYLSYNKSAAGGAAATPSLAVLRVKTLLRSPEGEELEPRRFEDEPPADSVYTPEAALDRLCEFAPDERAAVADLLQEANIPAAATLSRPVVERNATIAPSVAAEKVFKNRSLSPTQLESFATCQFAYYCDKILRLREEKSATLALTDTGTFLHYVLEKVVSEVMRMLDDGDFPAPDRYEAVAQELVTEVREAYRRDLEAASGPLTPRASALLDRLSILARLIVLNLLEEFADSDFRPVATELSLRKFSENCFIPLPSGANLALAGTIDRVDLWRKPKNEEKGVYKDEYYVRVVDYKTGRKKFSREEIKEGFSMQMILYLRALTQRAYPLLNQRLHLPPDTVLRHAGVSYFSSYLSSEVTAHRKDSAAALRDVRGNMERSGVTLSDEDLLRAASHSAKQKIVGNAKSQVGEADFAEMFRETDEALAALTDKMMRGEASAVPAKTGGSTPCKYCRYAAICRTAKLHAKGEDDDDAT